MLTAEQARDLDGILKQEGQVCHMEDRASFQAALSIGLDLGRLNHAAL